MTEFSAPPQATEIEASLLAACLINPTETVPDCADELQEIDFYNSRHKAIWKSIKALTFIKSPIDLVTVAQYLSDNGLMDQVGGAGFLSTLIDESPMSTDLSYHIKILKEKRALRQAIELCNAITKRCLDRNRSAVETVEKLQADAVGISIDDYAGDLKGMGELSEESSDDIAMLMENENHLVGVKTGFSGLDNITHGFQFGDLVIISARPSMGKTAIATNMARRQAKFGIPVGVYSLEQPAKQLYNRMLACETGIDSMEFLKGRFNDPDLQKISDAHSRLWELPMWIDDKGGLTVEEICARARKYKKREDFKIIYIDHLQLVYSRRRFDSRNNELGYITNMLKSLAKDLNIVVVALSQLNRALENRPNPQKRPKLSDLRDSGNIEQDSDIVLFIYRPEVYEDNESMKWPGYTDFYFGKHRNGPLGGIDLSFDKHTTEFREIDTRYDEGQGPIG